MTEIVQTKLIELRDNATFIPALAIRVENDMTDASYLIRRAGYMAVPCVILMRLDDCRACNDPYDWGSNDRSHTVAHYWIQKNWHEIIPGQVIDVRVILGEVTEPAISERIAEPL